jgi:hypothetical protein
VVNQDRDRPDRRRSSPLAENTGFEELIGHLIADQRDQVFLVSKAYARGGRWHAVTHELSMQQDLLLFVHAVCQQRNPTLLPATAGTARRAAYLVGASMLGGTRFLFAP